MSLLLTEFMKIVRNDILFVPAQITALWYRFTDWPA